MDRQEAIKELRLLMERDKYGNNLTEMREFLQDVDDDEDKQEAVVRFMKAAERWIGGNVFHHINIYDLYAMYEDVQNENA